MTPRKKSFSLILLALTLTLTLVACSQSAEKSAPQSKDQISPATLPAEELPSSSEQKEVESLQETENKSKSEKSLEDSMLEKAPAKKSVGQNNTSGESNSRQLKVEKLKSFQSESGKGADAEIQAAPEAEEDADTELQTEERGGTVITTNN